MGLAVFFTLTSSVSFNLTSSVSLTLQQQGRTAVGLLAGAGAGVGEKARRGVSCTHRLLGQLSHPAYRDAPPLYVGSSHGSGGSGGDRCFLCSLQDPLQWKKAAPPARARPPRLVVRQTMCISAATGFNSPWTLAIRAAADQGRPRRAITLYLSSLLSPYHRPCPFALAAVLKSVPRLPAHAQLPAAASLHAHLLRLGLLSHPYPHAALAHLYSHLLPPTSNQLQYLLDEPAPRHRLSLIVASNSRLASLLRAGDVLAARALFDGMPARDVVSWNSMVAGLAKAGHLDEAVQLFDRMPERNAASWNALMSGFIAQGQLSRARELFEQMPVRNNVSWVTMISGYAKAGEVYSAATLFERMENKDLYVWNAMIAGYAQNGCAREALDVFNRMLKPHVWVLPNEKTFSSVISACSQVGDLRFGLWVESFMGCVGVELDDHLRTALVDLYTKTGRIDRAFDLFRGLKIRDVVSYSAMIVGCGMHGKLNEALDLFKEMSDAKIDPNAVTFVGLLSAYNHAGLIEEARSCFNSMSNIYSISPSVEHYTIMVDLLGRSGKLDEAFQLITQMPMRPHASVWGALLLACRLHNSVELGEVVAFKCFELAPQESGYYILLGNIYAQAEKWDKVKRLRKIMTERGFNKMPGSSWVT